MPAKVIVVNSYEETAVSKLYIAISKLEPDMIAIDKRDNIEVCRRVKYKNRHSVANGNSIEYNETFIEIDENKLIGREYMIDIENYCFGNKKKKLVLPEDEKAALKKLEKAAKKSNILYITTKATANELEKIILE